MSGSYPETELLLDIANSICKLFDCTQLAIRLKINEEEVTALKEVTRDPREIAFRVLKKWRLQKSASSRMLYEALNKKPFEHLARQYKDALLCIDNLQTSSRQPQIPVTMANGSTVANPALPGNPLITDKWQIEVAMASGKKTDPEIEKIPPEALVELASLIGSQSECVRLAAKLGFEGVDIIQWSRSMHPVENIAQDIFMKWATVTAGTTKGKQSILEKALLEVGRRDLYEIFNKKCDYLKVI